MSKERWISDEVPSFAVVGRVNMGKTSVLATLLEIDDDKALRISATPGETTICQILPVEFDGEEHLRFIDTPGFSRPVDALRQIKKLAGQAPPGPEHVRRFVADETMRDEFEDECLLLEPIVEGAGVIYIVDPSKPLRPASLAEIEILRWTGRPRLAVLNCKEQEAKHEKEWRERLGTAFNLVRTFNAHRARYAERRRLLVSLLDIEEKHAGRIERVVESITGEWEQRREESAETIIDFLEDALTLRVEKGGSDLELETGRRRKRLEDELKNRYHARLAKLERACLQSLLRIYRHKRLDVGDSDVGFEGLDLLSEESWRKWGLNRWQLTAAGAVAGVAAGAAVDISTGGHTLGAGMAVGGMLGGAAAFFKGESLPELKVKRGMPVFSFGGGRTLVVGPPNSPNFPWLLLDSILLRYRKILERTHARRDDGTLRQEGEGISEESITRTFSPERRKVLQKWFVSCMKGKPDRVMEADVYRELVETLKEIEG